jgi:hypothetical protein
MMMTLAETIAERPTATKPTWSAVTHRVGWILQARILNQAEFAPYDPDPKWTKAAFEWTRHAKEEDIELEGAPEEPTPPYPQPEKGDLLLGVTRAKSVAQIVMKHYQEYNKLVERVVAGKDGLSFVPRDEKSAVRFDPGLIVDLPGFSIQKSGKDVATGRLCLTICMHESRSKIWSRISSADDRYWGRKPTSQTQTLIEKGRAWFDEYAVEVKDLYAQHISEALRSTGENRDTDVGLTVANHIELVSGDTTLRGLGRLSAAVANEEKIDRDPLATEAAETLNAMVRATPGMELDDGGVSAILRSSPTMIDSKLYYFVPHRTARGYRGIYVVRSEKGRITFAGVASADAEPYVTMHRLGESERQVTGSPSQHVTAELANTVAKYF